MTPASPSNIADKQRRLQEQLAALKDSQARLAWLVERARQRPPLSAESRTDAHLIPGCLSRLWFVAELRAGRCHFQSDSDSAVVKAVAGLLCEFYSNLVPEEIVGHDPKFLGNLGVTQHLTPNRRNGLAQVWQRIHAFAKANLAEPAP